MLFSIGTFKISIADLPCEWLESKSGHRLYKFLSDANTSSYTPPFLFKLTDSIEVPSLELFKRIGHIRFFSDQSSSKQYFITDEMQSVIDWKRNEMQASVPITASDESNDDLMFKVLVQLRLLVSFLVVNKGGIPLHSSSVFKNSLALVFFGKSGIGKTTIAGLMKEKSWSLLNDEYNLLLPWENSYRVFSTPFTKREPDEIHEPGGMQIKGIFGLQRGEHKITPLNLGFQVKLLLASTYLFPDYSRIQDHLLNNAISICSALNPCILNFQNLLQTATILDDLMLGGPK